MNPTLTTAIARDGSTARSVLTVNEAEACARLAQRSRRSDFRAGRLAAKRAASGLLDGRPARRIEVTTLADGAPRIVCLDSEGRGRPVEEELSLAHREGRAVAVVAPSGTRVGVGLERAGSVPLQMIQHNLTPLERSIATEVDPTILWSLKQAAWKALGLGSTVPIGSIELRAGPSGQLLGVEAEGLLLPVHTRVGEPWPGFLSTMVWMSGAVG